MRNRWNSTYWVIGLFLVSLEFGLHAQSKNTLAIQDDGSLVVMESGGSVADFVKQGTPRQAVQINGQSCNVNYGFNSAGKKTVLVGVPANAAGPVTFVLGQNQVTVPPKSALRLTLSSENRIETQDGNPANSVQFTPVGSAVAAADSRPTPAPPAPATLPVAGLAEPLSAPVTTESPTTESPLSPAEDSMAAPGWPGKLIQTPIPENQKEEDPFYARTEFGPRFMSSMSLVTVSGQGNYGILNQKQIAFSTGYRQDIDVGVWLTDWFGLAVETGFALNAVRGNTEGMTVSSTTFWTVPLLAQICFQYPNESGWIPYLNFGFGGGWTIFKVGGIDYTSGGVSIPASLSGTGNSVNNAYQIAAGVRYRLYEELSLTLAYKFYGNSQANVNLDNGVQATLGSPVTQSAEVGLNFSF